MNIEDIEGLEDRLDTKADVVHPHPTSDIVGLVEILAEKAQWDHQHDLSDIPDIFDSFGQSFAPNVHQHTLEQVTGLQGALNLKSNTGHGHTIAQVTNLQTALDGKSSTGHGHAISDVTNLQDSLNAKSSTGHGHAISDITDLQTSLNNKASSDHEHEIADIDGLSAVLEASSNVQGNWTEGNNLNAAFIKNKPGLGTASVRNVGTGANDVAAGNHTHSAADITSGTINLARLPTIPGTVTVVSSGNLAALTDAQLAQIITGTSVVTTDGTRYVYSAGDKRLASSYVVTSRTAVDYSSLVDAPGFASTLEGGLMTSADKLKLNGVESGANYYDHPTTDGSLHVPATGTSKDGQVLMAGNAAKTFSWKPVAISNVTGLQNALDVKSGTAHTHGNLKADGSIGTVAGKFVVTGEGGVLIAGASSTLPTTPPTHSHGLITNDGKVGDTANLLLVTGTSGAVKSLATGTHGQVLALSGGVPTWSAGHPTGDGNLHVPATSTTNNGKILTAGNAAGSFSWQSLPSNATPAAHTHGSLTNDGKLGDTAHRVVVTGTGGAVTQLNASGTSGQVLTSGGAVAAPSWGSANNHTHGLITNDGKVGDTANLLLVTGTSGAVKSLATGTNGQVLALSGGVPTWSAGHPTGDGNLHVPATGTANIGKVLTAGATAGSATWQTPATAPAVTSVANISGGTAGQLLFQSGVGTTSKIVAGTTGQVLRSGGATPAGPSWATLGTLAFKETNECVATDFERSVLKIQKMTPAEYQALTTKEAKTLYIIV
jgi:hypothetical protein